MSIYDVKFYGVISKYAEEPEDTQIALNKEELDLKSNFKNILFEVTVLKEFKGKQYVVELKSEDDYYEYVCLFGPREYYFVSLDKWYPVMEDSNQICEKIMECYIKYINS